MLNNTNAAGEIILYKSADGSIRIEVLLEDETVWITQEQMAALFGKGRSTITEHIKNIFSEGELQEEVVCRNFRHTTQHGAIPDKTQETQVKHYNLDVIISVGYRVKSRQGTQFRGTSRGMTITGAPLKRPPPCHLEVDIVEEPVFHMEGGDVHADVDEGAVHVQADVRLDAEAA
ncbi:MAG: virulence RhuM family protein [Treponema sp.]|nr:virulence RhuM family protein [Treponema sp.]